MRIHIASVCAAFWTAICASYGQATTNGTVLADSLTSRSRVVVDAFANASNRVHALIQEVSPAPDLSGYATTGEVAAVSNAVSQKADLTRTALVAKYYTAPSVFYSGNWCLDLVEGRYVGDLEYDAALTRACADGRVYWQGTTSYRIEGEEGTFYAMVIVRLGVDGGGATYDVGSAVNILDYARISTPEALAGDVNWNGSLTKTEYGFVYEDSEDSYEVSVGEDSQLAAYDSGTESVVYDLDLTNAINGIAAQMDGKLSTTGGVVTGNIILPQTGGSGGKTTINGNGITAGMEGFTIDSNADILLLKGSSAELNFPDIVFANGWGSVRDGDGNSIAYIFGSTNDFVRKSDIGQTITNVAEVVTGDATNALAVALGDSIESVRQSASNANNNVDYLEQFTIPTWRTADLLTATNFTKAYIATNNPAFVAAVTNCPVAIAAGDAEALTEWGIYGGGGTIGALLAALAAAVAALKKKKMPLYPVGGTGNPVNATYESGVLTISPFSMAAYTPTASAAFSVAMGALPSDMEAGKARDAVLVIDCSSLTDGQEPTVTWGTHFHSRTDAGTDFACAAGARNVYYISEYATGEFVVGGWTETAGGNA